MKGKLVLVIGPTGSGKGTLLSHVRERNPEIVFPVSCTTRAMRPGEVHGQTYYFITEEEFDTRLAQSDFLETASYGGNKYGTLKSEILPYIDAGKIVIREIEVQGARHIQKIISPDILRIIYVDAGSWDALERRIVARAPIGQPELDARRKRYEDETSFKSQATVVIENKDGELEDAKQKFEGVIRAFMAE